MVDHLSFKQALTPAQWALSETDNVGMTRNDESINRTRTTAARRCTDRKGRATFLVTPRRIRSVHRLVRPSKNPGLTERLARVFVFQLPSGPCAHSGRPGDKPACIIGKAA